MTFYIVKVNMHLLAFFSGSFLWKQLLYQLQNVLFELVFATLSFKKVIRMRTFVYQIEWDIEDERYEKTSFLQRIVFTL